MKRKITLCICVILAVFIAVPVSVNAASAILPTAYDNTNVGLTATSELIATDSGYSRVFYDGKAIRIEDYDHSFHLQAKRTLPMELEYWGGFYAGADAYYIVTGQPNKEESYAKEVIRVIKYDKNWNRQGAAAITGNEELFGGHVRFPFDVGCVEFTEHEGMLYIVTGHEGYVDDMYGQGHQGFLMIAVDQASMTGAIVDCDLYHSFAQYIETDHKNIYMLEQSEGGRCTKLSKYPIGSYDSEHVRVLEYGGTATSAWSIPCYASVDDMALSTDNVLCIGTSIDQAQYDSVTEDTPHNIYLTITSKDLFWNGPTTVKWLTDYTGGGKSFFGVKLTKIHDDRFMVSWEEFTEQVTGRNTDTLAGYTLHYLFIDGSGNVVSREYKAAAPISDCEPIVAGDKVVYYASNWNTVNFYTIDVNDGTFDKTIHRVAGENATWSLSDNTLKISGTGDIVVNGEYQMRYPRSSVNNIYSYSSSDNGWNTIRDNVKKIVVGKGLTSISDGAFAGFPYVKEVIIEEGMKTIGKRAFANCDSLEKVVIPSSVTKIGKDIVWNGYFWMDGSHAYSADIYTLEGSYAAKYAKENGVGHVLSHDYGSWKVTKKATQKENGKLRRDCKNCDKYQTKTIYKVSSVKLSVSSTSYNGKVKNPTVKVKDSKGKTISSDYYTVTKETGRKLVGRYKYKITFKDRYKGAKSLYLTIKPATTEVKDLKAVKKGFKAAWNKVSAQASGYEVMYATDSRFTKNKKTIKVKGSKATSIKVTKLKTKQTYYVKVRTYKVADGKTYYANWSKVKKAKTK